MHISLLNMKHFSQKEKEKQWTESHKSRVERNFPSQSWISRGEKEFFWKSHKLRKKRIFIPLSWKSRREREMKIPLAQDNGQQWIAMGTIIDNNGQHWITMWLCNNGQYRYKYSWFYMHLRLFFNAIIENF